MFQKKFQAMETDGHKVSDKETDGHKCVVEIVNKVQR